LTKQERPIDDIRAASERFAQTLIYEDNHLLVCNKPADLATMGDADSLTLHRLATAYLKIRYNKPAGVYVGIVSRLDRMTTGAIVLARTSKAASRLSAQFASRSEKPEKIYLAVVEGDLPGTKASLSDWIFKDEAAHRMRCMGDQASLYSDVKTQRAELCYEVLARLKGQTVVAVRLMTGRKHQIRVQFADRGFPVVGDRKYGADTRWPLGIALHSRQLRVVHPTLRQPMTFTAPLPNGWPVAIRATIERLQSICPSPARKEN